MSGLDREEILRKDCPNCRGNGYVSKGGIESTCERCDGSGLIEKVVPFKFDGPRTKEDLDDIWNE